jgi:hypothetical protein
MTSAGNKKLYSIIFIVFYYINKYIVLVCFNVHDAVLPYGSENKTTKKIKASSNIELAVERVHHQNFYSS